MRLSMTVLLLSLSALAQSQYFHQADDSLAIKDTDVEKSELGDTSESIGQPKMRVVDRDWSYFKAIPCEHIDRIQHHSRSEKILIAQRKSQCMGQYKAFYNQPLER